MRFARAVLVLSALPFGWVGLGFLLRPEAMAACVDVSLASATAGWLALSRLAAEERA
jgi:hypothetical protein